MEPYPLRGARTHEFASGFRRGTDQPVELSWWPLSSTTPTGKVSASPDGSHTPLILLASQRTPSGCRES